MSWNCDNTECYLEMFCEPTREGCLVRRPGNCYSNILYLFAGLVVLLSTWQQWATNSFAVADTMFGVMLLILATLSVIWHASNAPKSQYIDLWSMDSCIAYLIVRITCLGVLSVCAYLGASKATSAQVAPASCAVMFGALIAKEAHKQWLSHKAEYLDGGCPFSSRNRLLGRGGSRGSLVKKPPSVFGVCIFLGMPVVYMVIPTVVMACGTGSAGSVVSGTVMLVALVIGWSWRMLERFAMDGCGPMNAVHSLQKRWLTEGGGGGVCERVVSFVLTTLA